jgi:hypothetical protein
MKLIRVSTDDIVIVRHERHFAVAEARELKSAGFGQRQVVRVMPGEWHLQARSYPDFQRLVAPIPDDYVGVTPFMNAELKVPMALPSGRRMSKPNQRGDG